MILNEIVWRPHVAQHQLTVASRVSPTAQQLREIEPMSDRLPESLLPGLKKDERSGIGGTEIVMTVWQEVIDTGQ